MVVKSSNSKDGKPYRVVELFSGIGAQHMALERAGLPYQIVGICDIDPYAVQAYEAIHGPAPMLGETTDKAGRRIGDVTRIQHLPKDVDILTYSFPCFVGDTLIRTMRGEVPIRDVAVGDAVLSHDGRWHPVIQSMKTGTKQTCSFKAMCGESIVCTPEHPIYARRMSRIWNNEHRGYDRVFAEPEWIPANEADGCYAGFPIPEYRGVPEWNGIDLIWSDGRRTRHKNELAQHMNEESFWWTVGRYIADGWTRTNGGIVLAIGKGKEGDISNIFTESVCVTHEKTCLKVHLPKKEIQAFCEQFGVGAENKHIPEEYIGLPKNLAKALLDGYLSGDGSVNKEGKIRATTVSRRLAHDLVRLIAYVYHRPASIYHCKVEPTTEIEGRTVNQRDRWEVSFKTTDDAQDKAFYEDGWIWAPFRFEHDGEVEDVYDLEVEDSHSFIANGIAVHNCTDLSQAHLGGKGLKGEHSGLIWAVGDILRQAEEDGRLPRYLIMENVPQVFSKKNRKDWDAWMDFLASLGYTSRSGLLNAKDFPGTGQNRNRAFMISHLGSDCPPLPIAPGGDTVLADVLEEDVDPKYYLNKSRVEGLKKSTAKEKGRGNGFKFKPLDPETSVSHAITMREGQRKTSNFVRDPTRCQQAGTVEGMSGYDSLKRVYSPQGVSPTIVAKKGGNTEAKILEGKSDIRKLTPRETFRLQSFGRRKKNGEWDDSAYEKAAATGLSDGRLYGMAGNSINVNVFTPILENIDRFDIETDGGRKGQKNLDNWTKSRSAKRSKR